ncbi:unnamed protein product, partial [Polarella glacialis]
VHDISLRADTFGEAFSLSGASLASCLMNSPTCTGMYYEYAKEFLGRLRCRKGKGDATNMQHQAASERIAEEACQANAIYSELHPDPKTVLDALNLYKRGVVEVE